MEEKMEESKPIEKWDRSPIEILATPVDNGYIVELKQLDIRGNMIKQTIVGSNKKFVENLGKAFLHNELFDVNKKEETQPNEDKGSNA